MHRSVKTVTPLVSGLNRYLLLIAIFSLLAGLWYLSLGNRESATDAAPPVGNQSLDIQAQSTPEFDTSVITTGQQDFNGESAAPDLKGIESFLLQPNTLTSSFSDGLVNDPNQPLELSITE